VILARHSLHVAEQALNLVSLGDIGSDADSSSLDSWKFVELLYSLIYALGSLALPGGYYDGFGSG
jgi:hypothetical protein